MPDATLDSLIHRQFVRDNIGSICHERQSTRTLSGGKVCYECAMGFSREGKYKFYNYQCVMVPRGGIEPPTRGYKLMFMGNPQILIILIEALDKDS